MLFRSHAIQKDFYKNHCYDRNDDSRSGSPFPDSNSYALRCTGNDADLWCSTCLLYTSGDLSAIRVSVDAAVKTYPESLIDSFVLGNPHESLYRALHCTAEVDTIQALGVIETFTGCLLYTSRGWRSGEYCDSSCRAYNGCEQLYFQT